MYAAVGCVVVGVSVVVVVVAVEFMNVVYCVLVSHFWSQTA